MNEVYEKIKKLANNRSMTISELCHKVGITESGFHAAVKNNSLKLKTIQIIAEVLEVPQSYFFEENQNNLSTNSSKSKTDSKKNNESYFYEMLLAEKDKRIDFLQGLVISKLDNLEKLGKYRGATTMNGVGFGILDYSDMAFRAN